LDDSDEWRYQLFGGERVPFSKAEDRCSVDASPLDADTTASNFSLGLRLCSDPYLQTSDCEDPDQGGCDFDNMFWWTFIDCSVSAKVSSWRRVSKMYSPSARKNVKLNFFHRSFYVQVNLEGDIAVVHDHNNTIDFKNGELEFDRDGECDEVL
jgi:hypothetical protein